MGCMEAADLGCRRAPDGILQVIAHMMPDLPNVGWERDVESFTEFFENPAFRTDGLKLYPTLVIRGTGLYELWKAGLYRNYDPSLLVELVTCLRWPLMLCTSIHEEYLPQLSLSMSQWVSQQSSLGHNQLARCCCEWYCLSLEMYSYFSALA